MAEATLQVKGLEALQRKLKARKEALENGLITELSQLAEEAVVYSKSNKGYRDRTANLKNSISFALFKDGEQVTTKIGNIPKPEEAPGGQEAVQAALEEYAASGVVAPKGFSLVIVAGMEYGRYVEDKGYNVLHLTRYFLRDEMKKIIERVIERIKNDEV